jgi:hypothetical protein
MADNVDITPGTGATVAADLIGGALYQRAKIAVGADGVASDAIPVSDGLNTTAAGVIAAGIVGQFDDVAIGVVSENQFAPVRISTRRALLVEGVASGTAQPVSDGGGSLTVDGTMAVTQSGTWDEVGINDSGNSITVDNGGTFAVQVDGSALTSLQLIDDVVQTEDLAHSSGHKGIMPLAVRLDSAGPLAGTDGDYSPLQVDSNGALRVVGSAGTTQYAEDTQHASGDSVVFVGAIRRDTVPASSAGSAADYTAINCDANGRLYVQSAVYTPLGDSAMDDTLDAVKVSIVGDTVGSTVDTEDGSVAAAQSSVALTIGLPYDYDGSAWVRRVTSHLVDDAAFTPGTTGVTVAGFQADESSTDSVDEGDAGAARMTLDRKVIVTSQPHTTGGLSIFRDLSLSSTDDTLLVVKNSPGQVYGMWVTNTATSTRFVKLYNATSGTLGSDTPVITIGIPGNTSDDVSGNFSPGGMGIAFSTGICIGAATGAADNSAANPTAGDVIVNVFYK